MNTPANKTQPQPNNARMSQHLQNQGAKPRGVAFEEEVKQWFVQNAKRMRSLCGSESEAKKILISALNSVAKTPSLIECTRESFFRCLLMSAEYKLIPGATGECAYVPFRNNKREVSEATFIIQYQGLVQLMYRSNFVKDIKGAIVRANDHFEYKQGTGEFLNFEPYDGDEEERGPRIGVWTIIRNIHGGEHINYLTAKQIAGFKSRSRASGSNDSPWNSPHSTDVDWMWLKTSLKQNGKLFPKSADMPSMDDDETSDVDAAFSQKAQAMQTLMGSASAMLDAPPSAVDVSNISERDAVPVSGAKNEGAMRG